MTVRSYSNKNKTIVAHSASASQSLWDGCKWECETCFHGLDFHSRNDDPEHGHCLYPGCPCIYFKSQCQQTRQEALS
jgi:hypothetical protein